MNETLEAEEFEEAQIKEKFLGHKAFFTRESVTFLFGAGCSVKAGLPLMEDLTKGVLESFKAKAKANGKTTLDFIEGSFSGSQNGRKITIEDYMSDITDYISIAERHIKNPKVLLKTKTSTKTVDIEELKNTLSCIKKEVLADICKKQKRAMRMGRTKKHPKRLDSHINFVEMVHSGKHKVDYFILNYDTLIETALGLNKVKYADGFSSGPIGWLEKDALEENKTKSEENETTTFVHKLHGSIDWSLIGNEPRRIDPNHYLVSKGDDILIYPSVKKTTEVYRDPFIEKLNCFREALRENKALIVCGYGFGDSHINLEIEEALQSNESNKIEVLIIFVDGYNRSGDDYKSTVIDRWFGYEREGGKISVYAGNGFFQKGRNPVKIPDKYKECYKFEKIVEILRGVSG